MRSAPAMSKLHQRKGEDGDKGWKAQHTHETHVGNKAAYIDLVDRKQVQALVQRRP